MKKFLATVIIGNILLLATINSSIYVAAALSAVDDSSMLPYPDGKVEEDTQRYLRIDEATPASVIHGQVKEQFSEFLQGYQAYFETQRDF